MRRIPGLFMALGGTALSAALAAGAAHGEEGAQLALACTSCHGIDGRSGGAIPALARRDEAELLGLMQGFAAQEAGGAEAPTIMPRLLRVYDADELKALAAYFAGIRP